MLIEGDSTAKLHLLVDSKNEKLNVVRVFRFNLPNVHPWFSPIQGKVVAMAVDGFALALKPLKVFNEDGIIEREIQVPARIWKMSHMHEVRARSISYKETEWSFDDFNMRFEDNGKILDWSVVFPRYPRESEQQTSVGLNIELLNKIRQATGTGIVEVEYGKKDDVIIFRSKNYWVAGACFGLLMPVR